MIKIQFKLSITKHCVIESEVPYSTLIDILFQLHPSVQNQVVARSRQYERPYLAWETVRKLNNPFFTEGTGLEGYYVGLCSTADEMFDRLIQTGHKLIKDNALCYRFNYRFQSHLMKTIRNEAIYPEAVEVWSAQFGGLVAGLRCKMLTNMEAKHFQLTTYQIVTSLPMIQYHVRNHSIRQEYAIRSGPAMLRRKLSLQNIESLLKPSDVDAWLVIRSAGKFGHPLLREYLTERNRLEPHRIFF